MQFTQEEIKKFIAHRDPFLFLDRVINCDVENKEIHAQFDVKENWDVFKGHFPGGPIMPGVLITEACAQASAVLTSNLYNKTSDEILFYFMAIDSVRFRQPVTPNCTLDFKVKLVKQKASVVKFEGKVYVDDVLVTECAFTSKVLDR